MLDDRYLGGGYIILYLFIGLKFFIINYDALSGHSVSFWDIGNVLKLDYGNSCTTLNIPKAIEL